MNERFKELAELCYEVNPLMVENSQKIGNDGVPLYNEVFNQEKFAELIVRECMRMCEVTEMSFVTHDCDVEASGAITVKHFIAEHFGVE